MDSRGKKRKREGWKGGPGPSQGREMLVAYKRDRGGRKNWGNR